MALSVECECGRTIKVREEMAGKRIKCPDCGSVVRIPSDDDDEPMPVETKPAAKKKGGAKKGGKGKSGIPKPVLILGSLGLVLIVMCGGCVLTVQSFLAKQSKILAERRQEFEAERKVKDDERRSQGIPVTVSDYRPLVLDTSRAPELTQEITLGTRRLKLPAGFQPMAVPSGNRPPTVQVQFYERPDANSPVGKQVIGIISEPRHLTHPETLSYSHELSVSKYFLSSRMLEENKQAAVYGKLGSLYVARQLLTGKMADGKLATTLFATLLDDSHVLTFSATAFGPEDAATLQLFEAVLSSLQ